MIPIMDTGQIVNLAELDYISKHEQKIALGQFMTPPSVAQFMAGLFTAHTDSLAINLLDAGAGCGSLSNAFLQQYLTQNKKKKIHIRAYEIDVNFSKNLSDLFDKYSGSTFFSYEVLKKDFIEDAVNAITENSPRTFTHAILNPPYKKIHSESKHRKLLHSINIETVNLYTAFLYLSIHLLADKGELVAIVPRSFCNGCYYKSFRKWLLEVASIKQLHLFNSRKEVFKNEKVLQETIIIHLIKGGSQGEVILSFAEDETFLNYYSYILPFNSVVEKDDDQFFIRIPSKIIKDYKVNDFVCFNKTLSEIGIEVSTGPIVDFRLKNFLLAQPTSESVPLLYSLHFENNKISWPKQGGKKPNAIKLTTETIKLLWPNGFYVVVKRISSKEEKRRIVANLVNPSFAITSKIGFENHLNVFHFKKSGLPESLAYGLMTFLNSSLVDEAFRAFSGHTQVNATDLRALKYPPKDWLINLGDWAKKQSALDQDVIDRKIKEISRAQAYNKCLGNIECNKNAKGPNE